MSVRRFRMLSLITTLVMAATVAACADDGAPEEAAKDQTLTVWHYERPESAMAIAWAEAIRLFKEAHPGVTVRFEQKTFEQIRQNAAMALNADDPPTVVEYNKGNSTAGLLAKQGVLTDFTGESTKRGWDRMLTPSLQTTTRYDTDGIMGSGAVYGIPNYSEFVLVYYNKDMFAKHGVAVPQTLSAFEAAMDVFVKAGITPLSVGGAEYPAQQIFYELVLSKADRAFVDAYQRYMGNVDFTGPAFQFGATTFASWVRKGYIAKDSARVKAEDMNLAFMKQRFPIVIVGSWMYGDFVRGIKDFEWGTFLFPGNRLHPGSSGNLWVVPAKAKDKSLAYDFIDITMKPEIQRLLAESGGVPVHGDASAAPTGKNTDLLAHFATIEAADGLAFYPDWPAAGYYDVLGVAIQDLINGTKKPDEVLADIAKPYHDNVVRLGK
ncbi:raffinose/stachyose/melibiose transport system substrate-binding protein [Actinoplanes philippinensis]|uniref:Raffinose/stachyose/melibiose transport system substrate-binding protein n=2 Tax=Actinoplanes philippinensis TaxID=35752 RepID=A0A1I2I7L0_9ACTN|nr:raffinose/stachyose/melibiose transport system substrate-binding protein [Actinoplanes philippinensis]